MKKVAVPALGETLSSEVSDRFGRTPYILIVGVEGDQIELVEAISNAENAVGAQGAGTSTAESMANAGAQVVVAPNVGPNAWKALEVAGIKAYQAPARISVEEAVKKYIAGELEPITGATREGEHRR